MSKELDDLVEKVARAMQAKTLYPTMTWDNVGHLTREMWRGDAPVAIRAVAEATRKPSEAMCADACGPLSLVNPANPIWEDAEEVWCAMFGASVIGEAMRDE
jgi:hypothetical protein